MKQEAQCKGCGHPAPYQMVDCNEPILDRRQLPACSLHAILWSRQPRIVIFLTGDVDADQLSTEEIQAQVREMPRGTPGQGITRTP